MVNSFPCEEPEVLEALLRARKFRGSKLRTNVARGAETERHSSGRVMLKEAVLSDVVKSGHLFNNVRKHHPRVEQLTLNKNLCCTRHTDRNEGTSLIAFFGDFTGGGLFVEEPDGVKHLQGKGIWFEYNGRHPHWTEEFEGERYSIVAYKKPKAKESENKDIIVASSKRDATTEAAHVQAARARGESSGESEATAADASTRSNASGH